MGCCGSKHALELIPKKDLPKEEKVIREQEKTIPWSNKSAKELQRGLKAESLTGQLSVAQLKRAMHDLNIDSDMFVNPESPVYKFLKKLMNDRKLYDVKRLALCGILVGEGSVKEKAGVIFNHFDEDASGQLERGEIVNMLNEMIDIAVEKIPAMAKGSTEVTAEELDAYTAMLLTGRHAFVERTVSTLLSTNTGISLEDFETKLQENSTLRRLIWSYEIRLSLYEESNQVLRI